MHKLLLLRSPNTNKGSGRHMLLHYIPHLNTQLCFPKGGYLKHKKGLSTWKDPSVSLQRENFTDFQQLFLFFCGGGFCFVCFKWKMTIPETLQRSPAKHAIKHQSSLPREDTRHLARAQILSDKNFVPPVH